MLFLMAKKKPAKATPFISCPHTRYSPEWIKALRLHRGLTQVQAAKLIGITQGAWSHWEGDKASPDRCCKKLLDLLAATTI